MDKSESQTDIVKKTSIKPLTRHFEQRTESTITLCIMTREQRGSKNGSVGQWAHHCGPEGNIRLLDRLS